MSEPAPSRPGRLGGREPKLPSERDWERADVLEPRLGQRDPELVSDGTGLSFPPSALAGAPGALDVEDPAVAALLAYLNERAAPKGSSRAPWKRAGEPPPATTILGGWRELARTDDEALFALGRAAELLTITVRREGLRRRWGYAGSNATRALRATRDGIRASSWRPDPTHERQPRENVLRLLVTEQAFASGQRAGGRLLAPDLHLDEEEIVLRVFVAPRPGFQGGAVNPETPALVVLPEPVGRRRLVDGGALALLAPSAPPTTSDAV